MLSGMSQEKGEPNSLESFVKRFWKPNVTLMDPVGLAGGTEPLDLVTHNPFEFIDYVDPSRRKPSSIPGESKSWLFHDTMEFFLGRAVIAIGQLRDRFRIEPYLGDCINFLEKSKYGLLPGRAESNDTSGGNDLLSRKYDRIHLNNVT